MAFIKNIEHKEIVRLADEISANTGQVVSKTLAQNSCVSITLFAFAKGEEIGTHDSAGDAMVTVIEGKGRFVVDGREYCLSAGETLVMPARKPHSVHAEDAFKMLLTVVFPRNDSET
ncbi:cupin domain-containing protein [Ruthenibacterium lactatiformans]|uniref:cupin domain-containing protein n=1 Tax=Ruthenibacterium lactatiformans TaxID=1550024 RepID=UPI00242FA0BD|nr:cupin domain-containing protein [Ruthenibacterium lactatiformans]